VEGKSVEIVGRRSVLATYAKRMCEGERGKRERRGGEGERGREERKGGEEGRRREKD